MVKKKQQPIAERIQEEEDAHNYCQLKLRQIDSKDETNNYCVVKL